MTDRLNEAGTVARRVATAAVVILWLSPSLALGASVAPTPAPGSASSPTLAVGPGPAGGAPAAGAPTQGQTGGSLEAAAGRAGDIGRKVAFSLIGLALAVAAIVLAFKRDFKEAIGVLAVGLVAVLLASPAGVGLLQQTVSVLLGSA